MNPAYFFALGGFMVAAFGLIISGIMLAVVGTNNLVDRDSFTCHSCWMAMSITKDHSLPEGRVRDVYFTCPNPECRMDYHVLGNEISSFDILSKDRHEARIFAVHKRKVEANTLRAVNRMATKGTERK